MRLEKVIEFVEALGIEEYRVDGDWVRMCCPLAFWRHHKRVDSKPSFSITVNNNGPSVYHCFGCTPAAKRIGTLLHVIWILSGTYPKDAARVLNGQHQEFKRLDTQDFRSRYIGEEADVEPLPSEVLDLYPLLAETRGLEALECKKWMDSRKISLQTFARYRVRYSPRRRGIIFPFTDLSGGIFYLGFRSRLDKTFYSIDKEAAEKELKKILDRDFPSKKSTGVWFGLHLVNWQAPLMLVEGPADALRVAELGFRNVIASGGTMVVKRQIQMLSPLQLVLGYDADAPGRQAHKTLAEMIPGNIPLYEVDWSIIKKRDGSRCKDGGDLPDKESLATVMRKIKPVRK